MCNEIYFFSDQKKVTFTGSFNAFLLIDFSREISSNDRRNNK